MKKTLKKVGKILLAVVACGLIFFLIFLKRRKKDENKA